MFIETLVEVGNDINFIDVMPMYISFSLIF